MSADATVRAAWQDYSAAQARYERAVRDNRPDHELMALLARVRETKDTYDAERLARPPYAPGDTIHVARIGYVTVTRVTPDRGHWIVGYRRPDGIASEVRVRGDGSAVDGRTGVRRG